MAKTSVIQRNLKRKMLVEKFRDQRDLLKKMIKNKELSPQERFEAKTQLAMLPRDSSPTRVKNRCLITGRARGFYRKFQMSRICLRELASTGMIPGVKKDS